MSLDENSQPYNVNNENADNDECKKNNNLKIKKFNSVKEQYSIQNNYNSFCSSPNNELNISE